MGAAQKGTISRLHDVFGTHAAPQSFREMAFREALEQGSILLTELLNDEPISAAQSLNQSLPTIFSFRYSASPAPENGYRASGVESGAALRKLVEKERAKTSTKQEAHR